MPRDTKRDTRCRLTAMSAESAEEARVRIVAGRGLGGRRWMAFQTSYAGSIPVARSPPGVRQRVADHLEGAAVVVDVRWQAEGALDAWGVGDDGLLRDPISRAMPALPRPSAISARTSHNTPSPGGQSSCTKPRSAEQPHG